MKTCQFVHSNFVSCQFSSELKVEDLEIIYEKIFSETHGKGCVTFSDFMGQNLFSFEECNEIMSDDLITIYIHERGKFLVLSLKLV